MMHAVTLAAPDAKSLRHWLLGTVCPYWSERLTDPQGGFYEGIDSQGRPAMSPVRHVLVQARLTYVFSHAAVLNRSPATLAAADHGFAQLQRWSHSRTGGWARAQSNATQLSDSAVVDATRDTYDQAFVIFASAWYFRASGDPAAIAMAEQAYAFLQAQLADAEHGGFFEEHPNRARLPRRQNPHMHLLEATLAMHAATGEGRWLDASRQMVGLFEHKFYDSTSGSIGEFFRLDWSPAEGAEGALREPGHQFEWAWLLCEYAKASGDSRALALADRLFDFGQRFGPDTTGPLSGFMVDGVDGQGRISADTKLFWPQTEYIKACVVRSERGLPGMHEAAQAHLALLRAHYFRADGANWCNQFSRNGECLSEVTPARVLYHLFLAVAEVIRLKESAEASS